MPLGIIDHADIRVLNRIKGETFEVVGHNYLPSGQTSVLVMMNATSNCPLFPLARFHGAKIPRCEMTKALELLDPEPQPASPYSSVGA